MGSKTIRNKILQLISISHGIKQFHWNLYGSRTAIPWSTAWPLTAWSGCSTEKWTEELRANRAHQQSVKNVLKLSSSYYSIHILVQFALKSLLTPLGCCCSGWGVPGCTAAPHSLQEPGSRSAASELGVTQALPAPQRGPHNQQPKGLPATATAFQKSVICHHRSNFILRSKSYTSAKVSFPCQAQIKERINWKSDVLMEIESY